MTDVKRLHEQAKVYSAQCRGGVVLSTRNLAAFIDEMADKLAEADRERAEAQAALWKLQGNPYA